MKIGRKIRIQIAAFALTGALSLIPTGEFKDGLFSNHYTLAASNEKVGYATVNNLNIREEANTDSSRVGRLKLGEEVTIIGEQINGFWPVEYHGLNGFVASSYIDINQKQTANNSENQELKIVGQLVITGDEVFIRKSPNTSNGTYDKAKRGTVLSYVGKYNDDWYMISYNGQKAYVSSKYSRIVDKNEQITSSNTQTTSINGDTYYCTSDSVNLRADASTNSNRLGRINKNDKVIVVGERNGFYEVYYNNIHGFVAKEYLTKHVVEAIVTNSNQGTAVCLGDSVNVREGASTSTEVLFRLKRGDSVQIKGTSGDFTLINYNGREGYIASRYLGSSLNEIVSTSTNNSLVVKANHVRFRSSAEIRSDNIIGEFKEGERLSLVKSTNNGWLEVIYQGKRGYVSAECVTLAGKTNNKNNATIKYVYIRKDTNLNDEFNNKICVLPIYEVCEVLGVEGSNYYVKVEGIYGYVAQRRCIDCDDLVLNVDLADQELCVYYQNKLVYRFPVVTGMPGYETPTGVVNIGKMEEETVMTRYSERSEGDKIKYTIYYRDDCYIHCDPVGNDQAFKYVAGGLNHPLYGGSHGCIRTRNKDSKTLFKYLLGLIINNENSPRGQIIVTGPSEASDLAYGYKKR